MVCSCIQRVFYPRTLSETAHNYSSNWKRSPTTHFSCTRTLAHKHTRTIYRISHTSQFGDAKPNFPVRKYSCVRHSQSASPACGPVNCRFSTDYPGRGQSACFGATGAVAMVYFYIFTGYLYIHTEAEKPGVQMRPVLWVQNYARTDTNSTTLLIQNVLSVVCVVDCKPHVIC